MRKWLGAVLGGAAIISAAAVSAQTWGDESLDSVTARPAETAASASGITPPAEKVDEAAEAAEIKAGREAQRRRLQQIPSGARQAPAVNTVNPLDLPNVPTIDGSQRGSVAVNRVLKPGEQPDENEDQELIFIYYKDYRVRRMATGRVECDVKFVVLTSLNQKLSNLSLKLRWPKLTTSVVFLDVNPNIQVYHDYTLMGEGCYSMDKIPNIIVNRCRIKGLSQADCAKKIRWLKMS